MAKKKQSFFANFLICAMCLVLGACCSFAVAVYITLPQTEDVEVSEEVFYPDIADISDVDAEISIHFLELGNKYTGDCTYIKTKDADILIDCGSKSSSVNVVAKYLEKYVTDGVLEYVIVTHAHQDHYAGFATSANVESIFDLFECETIIDFAQTNQKPNSAMFQNYQRELSEAVSRGAKHFTAQDCIEMTKEGAQRVYEIGKDITLKILDSFYYTNPASTENDYSVCCMISQGDNNFLFTGDLGAKGEEHLVQRNALPQVQLYKAGHHGSKTSSTQALLSIIRPQVVCVCCCAGSSEYTSVKDNQFPTQEFINQVAPHTDKIYVTTLCVDYKKNEFTSFNGNIVFLATVDECFVKCSNNNTILKDSDWFKQNRTWPSAA